MFHFPPWKPLVIGLIVLGAAPSRSSAAGAGEWPAEAEAQVLARITAPKFPKRNFPITDFGAAPDTDCTESIAKAIAACNESGGGQVIIPPGVWLTGPVHLKSNVNLRISEGATLRFIPDPARYMPPVLTRFEGIECMNFSPLVYAHGQENIAVTGKGTLDGGASLDNWLRWAVRASGGESKQAPDRKTLDQAGTDGRPVEQRVFGLGHFLRPNFIQLYRCKTALIEGVTIINSPMWEIHPVLSTNVTVRGVAIHSLGANNDGCDPESCRDVLIEDCVFETGDDCIAIKSGRNNDGRRVGAPTENVIIRRCVMKDGHGGVTIGSEISGDCRNVFVEDCKMDSPNLERAFRFKSNAVRGGVIENIAFRNIQIGRVARAALSVEFDYEEGADGPFKPVLRNILISNVTSESSGRVMAVTAFPGAIIEGVRLRHCVFGGVEAADVLTYAGTVEMQNVTIVPAKKEKK